MKLSVGALFIAALLTTTSSAAPRTFTNNKGQRIVAEIVEATADTVTLRRWTDGKKFLFNTDQLSAADQALARKFYTESTAAKKKEAARLASATLGASIVKYCQENMGKQVGNGECWTLANDAFKALDIKRPGGQLRVWGRLVDLKTEAPQPGDIVEIADAKFADGSYVSAEHTAVIVKTGKKLQVTLAEQNWALKKIVHERTTDLGGLLSGTLKIYRAEPGQK